jgi:hypothetical protein
MCAIWTDSIGSQSSCIALTKVSDRCCWTGTFTDGGKAGQSIVLTYNEYCGWQGWYGTSSCDYFNDPISGKTWSKSLSCSGGTVQLTDNGTGAWEKIEFNPTNIPDYCCSTSTPGSSCSWCGEFTPKYVQVSVSGIESCLDICCPTGWPDYDGILITGPNPNGVYILTQNPNPSFPCCWWYLGGSYTWRRYGASNCSGNPYQEMTGWDLYIVAERDINGFTVMIYAGPGPSPLACTYEPEGCITGGCTDTSSWLCQYPQVVGFPAQCYGLGGGGSVSCIIW